MRLSGFQSRRARRSTSRALAIALLLVPAIASRAQDSTASAASGSGRATRTVYLPIVGTAPGTGLQLGATAYRISRRDADTTTRPAVTQLYAVVTTRGQFRAFVEHDRWSAGNVLHLVGRAQFERFPQPFYGFGADSPKDAEELYTPRTVSGFLTLHRRVAKGLYAGGTLRVGNTDIIDADSGGTIANDAVVGATGGRIGQLEANLVFDTRDNLFAPRQGAFVQLTGAVADDWTLSSFEFGRMLLDARGYLTRGRNTFAVQLVSDNIVSGDAPFDQVAMFGTGNSMRAYVRGRYRDNHLLAMQGEWRRPLVARLGMAAFAGAGTVASTLGNMGSATWLPTAGVGLRYQVFARDRATIRVDLGFGRDATGLYIALNEAF